MCPSFESIPGLRIGHADDPRRKTGVTALVVDAPSVASMHVMGGAPGTRETDLLAPEQTVQEIDALVLSGGSAFGLAAADGVAGGLQAIGRGFSVAGFRVPIVPAAILFDLANGGDKTGLGSETYRALGARAFEALDTRAALGSHGAGLGATTANLRGGFGAAEEKSSFGIRVQAFAAVNALGQATLGDGPHFWAAPFEKDGEFGGLSFPSPVPAGARAIHTKLASPLHATTLGAIVTDAALSKAQAKRLAIAAHDGFARALWPAHTLFDGDAIFSMALGHGDPPDDAGLVELGALAAAAMARAIALGVFHATETPDDGVPSWHERFAPL